MNSYGGLLVKTDVKLVALLTALGEKIFGVVSDAPMNPLEMLLGGGGGGKSGGKGPPPLDMSKMMQMMQQMKR